MEASLLETAFGDRLTSVRSTDCVHWAYEGNAALVTFGADGALDATFIAADVDAVTRRPVSAVYRASGPPYVLRPEDCARVVGDLIAFFSGAREPRFAFVDIVPR